MKQSKWGKAYICGLIAAVAAPWALVGLNHIRVANDADLVVGIPVLAVVGFVAGYIGSLVIGTKKIE